MVTAVLRHPVLSGWCYWWCYIYIILLIMCFVIFRILVRFSCCRHSFVERIIERTRGRAHAAKTTAADTWCGQDVKFDVLTATFSISTSISKSAHSWFPSSPSWWWCSWIINVEFQSVRDGIVWDTGMIWSLCCLTCSRYFYCEEVILILRFLENWRL